MKDEQRWPEGARMGIIDKQAAGRGVNTARSDYVTYHTGVG
jgi:hypothetical protein